MTPEYYVNKNYVPFVAELQLASRYTIALLQNWNVRFESCEQLYSDYDYPLGLISL